MLGRCFIFCRDVFGGQLVSQCMSVPLSVSQFTVSSVYASQYAEDVPFTSPVSRTVGKLMRLLW